VPLLELEELEEMEEVQTHKGTEVKEEVVTPVTVLETQPMVKLQPVVFLLQMVVPADQEETAQEGLAVVHLQV
jgi:hypothetical protein